jgi:hypothetical protein
LWFEKYFSFHCADCGGEIGYRSRARTFSERCLLPVLLLKPVRCGECFRRDYRLILMPVRKRLPALDAKRAVTEVPKPKRHVA